MGNIRDDDLKIDTGARYRGSVAIGVGAEIKADNMIALAAGGENLLEIYGDTGDVHLFGERMFRDRHLAENFRKALGMLIGAWSNGELR